MGFRFGTRRAFLYLVGASLLAASVVLAACGEETKKSGGFKLNPGEYTCRGYLKVSYGERLLLPGDFYWYGARSTGCIQG